MGKESLVFELSDKEIRVFCFGPSSFGKRKNRPAVSAPDHIPEPDRIPVPAGVIEQGNLRQDNALLDILRAYKAEQSGRYRKLRKKVYKNVYLAVPLQQGFLRTYSLPWLAKKDRKSAVALLVDEEIALARSDVLFDYLVLAEERPKDMQILLGAARRSLLEQYVSVFEQAGFQIGGIDFTLHLMGKSLGLKESEEVLYLQGDGSSLQIVLFCGTVPEGVRTLQSQEDWQDGIRRFLLRHGTRRPDLRISRLLWSGDAAVEALAQDICLYQHISATGEAERQLAANTPFNLWRQEKRIQRLRRRERGLAAFCCGLFLAGTLFWLFLSQTTAPLQEEVQELVRQNAQTEERVKKQRALEEAWDIEMGEGRNMSGRLAEIQAMPVLREGNVILEQVICTPEKLALSGKTRNAQGIQAFICDLENQGWDQPVLSKYQLTASGRVEFELRTGVNE